MSLLCRLKNLVHKGLLKKEDLDRIVIIPKGQENKVIKTGQWMRMSDLSEKEDDRYQCSRCKNVVHYKDKMNLYTFNSWCGRCGSNNARITGK